MFWASVCVFITTYMLILPAISVEKDKTDNVSGLYLENAEDIDEKHYMNDETDSETVTDALIADVKKASDEANEQTTGVNELSAIGDSYEIFVTYDDKTEIPDSARLEVHEITQDSEASDTGQVTLYDKYLDNTLNALGLDTGLVSYARVFDINITDELGDKVKPAEGTTIGVRIELTDNKCEKLNVVHFDKSANGDVVENIFEADDGQVVEFETDELSVDAIVGTVIEKNVLASDGQNYKIKVSYYTDSGIPVDANLAVEEILPNNYGATSTPSSYDEYVSKTENALGMKAGSLSYARVFDIKIVDQYDPEVKYQPKEGNKVDVRIELADAGKENGLSVVHFSDNEADGDIIKNSTENIEYSSVVEFASDGFSVFVVADEGPIRTYSFYSPDANGTYDKYYFVTDTGETVYQQKIKTVDGTTEELVIPQLPSIPGSSTSTFAGWYVYNPDTDTYADAPFDFTNIPEVTTEEEIILRAKFSDYIYVIFHEQYNGTTRTWPIAETRRGEKINGSTTIQVSDVAVTYDDPEAEENSAPEMAFRGWSLTKVDAGATVDQNGDPVQLVSDPITITENTDLYPVFVPINWLTFSSGPAGSGATYVPPRYYYTDEGEDSFPIPIRTGYAFDGWYTDEHGGHKIVNADGTLAITGTQGDFSVVDNELRIGDDVTLYGQWREADTKYTVVIWRQKATDEANLADDDKQYDFAESFTLNATTGSHVNVANTYKNLEGSGDYTGFHYDRCDNAKEVAGNGSTVLNVYYDRKVHTLTFRVNNTTRRTITALYGSSIKNYFPIVGTNGTTYDGYVWTDSGNPKVYPFVLSTIETMPDANVTFTGASGGTNKTIYYYVEVDNASESDGTIFNGKYYTLYKTVKHAYKYITYDEEYHPITGYIRDYANATPSFYYSSSRGGYTANIGSGNNNYLYYDRDTFEITFTDSYTNQNVVVNGSQVEPVSIKYNQKISNFIPDDPTSTRPGYRFTGWYANSACSTRVYFDEEEYNNSTAASKVLYDRMPAYNLRLFAGWETEWYLVEIDPNGGELTGTQATWFWEPYNGDPIEEYTTTTRNYQESLNGTWYYAVKDRDYYGLTEEYENREDAISERGAYYTQDVSDPAADLSRKYEYSQDAYRYAGWYEVHEDGSETLYAFGQPVMHNTKLRLHWKQLGTYYIRYDAGAGTLDNQDNNEDVFHTLDDADYADHANIVVTRTAEAPEGMSFVGWKIRGGDGTVYYPGQTFEFQSLYTFEETVDGIEKEYLILDAVYSTISSAEIIYDANGGTVDTENVDFGAPTDANEHFRTEADETSATISGLLNNSEVTLSTGSGFSLEGAEFKGWNTEPDASGSHYNPGEDYYVDKEEPVTLYAEWQVKVYFDKNNVNADWGGAWDAVDDEGNPIYTWDETRQQYYTYAYVNGTVDEPVYVPVSSENDERFAYWSPVRYTDSGEVAYEYDFSTPVSGELTLYGFWANAIQVPYHVVDASEETLVEVNDWKKDNQEYFVVNTGTEIPLEDKNDTETYVDIPTGYAYAFACVSDSLENCSEDNRIINTGYNTVTKRVSVTYADGTTEDLPSDKEIYLVYFEDPKTLEIDYKLMHTDGSLTDVNVAAAAPTSAAAGTYDMTANVTRPLAWANNTNYKYYSFAIGDENATNGSQIHMISSSSGTDNSRPALQIRNTWRGYQYSTDGGNTWVNYGYDPELYVVYYESEPTIVTIREQTVGTQDDMDEEFEYEVVITETVSSYERSVTQRRIYSWQSYSDYSEVALHQVDQTSSTVSDNTFYLADNDTETNTLFYHASPETSSESTYTNGYYTYREITYYSTITTQTITVTQRPKDGFTTTNNSTGQNHVSEYVYTYTTTSSSEDTEVTYTNTRTKEDVELHIALAQNGGFVAHDADMRTNDSSIYTISIPSGDTVSLSENSPGGLFTGDTDKYRFAGIIYGKEDEQGNITAYYNDVNSVSFKPLEDSEYLGVYMNDDPSKLLEEGYHIYYVYYPMPEIVYMKEGANGALLTIDPITRNNNSVTLNGIDVAQNTQLEVGSEAFIIDQSVAGGFRVPPDLDGEKALSLNYVKIGAGTSGVTNTSGLDGVSDVKSIQLKIIDGQVKYSFDGNTWLSFSGENPTVYVIYKEKGYDLTITKTVEGSNQNGEFDLTITSPAIIETAYTISGYEIEQDGETVTVETISAVPASGDLPGRISLKVKHGSNITISALQHGNYTIAEPNLTGYMMESSIGGYASVVTDNATSFVLNNDTTAEIKNKPSTVPVKVMKVDQTGAALEGAVFYFVGKDFDGYEEPDVDIKERYTSAKKTAESLDAIIIENDAVPLGTYILHEEMVPAGYIGLEGDVEITISSGAGGNIEAVLKVGGTQITNPSFISNEDGTWVIKIMNSAGIVLPYTGGFGTRMIYYIGFMLIALAGVGFIIRCMNMRKEK